MSDLAVSRWKQKGKIYLWHFPSNTRNYPGWEFATDAAGCSSLLELLDLMLNAQWSSSATIAIQYPPEEIASLPGWSGGMQLVSATRLTIQYPKEKVDKDTWNWNGNLSEPLLKVSINKLTELHSAVKSVSSGESDFCIHGDDIPPHGLDLGNMSIWFW